MKPALTAQIRWDLMSEAVPAFLVLVVMPLTYSFAYGAQPFVPFGQRISSCLFCLSDVGGLCPAFLGASGRAAHLLLRLG